MDAGERLGAACSFCGAQAGEPCHTITTGRPTTRVHAARHLTLVPTVEATGQADEPVSATVDDSPPTEAVSEPPVGSTPWLEELVGREDENREDPTWRVDVRELRVNWRGAMFVTLAVAVALMVLRLAG